MQKFWMRWSSTTWQEETYSIIVLLYRRSNGGLLEEDVVNPQHKIKKTHLLFDRWNSGSAWCSLCWILPVRHLWMLEFMFFFFSGCCLGSCGQSAWQSAKQKWRETLRPFCHCDPCKQTNYHAEQGESNKREERRWRWRVTRLRPWTRESKMRGLWVNSQPKKRKTNKNCWNLSKTRRTWCV